MTRAMRACAAAAAILMSGAVAVASPGDDLGQDEASCKLFPNPDFQADCRACIAKPGKHYHWNTHVCHGVKSAPPPPPAVITGVVTCARFLTDKKLAACEACITDGRFYLGKSGKCQDPDPGKMDPKPQLDRAACNADKLSASDRSACHTCVGEGGGFQSGWGCNLPKVKATDASPAVVDAKACAGDTVAPIQRKRCTACVKKGTHGFALGGQDAGECVLDPARFAAKYRLPPENWTTGFFTPTSCKLHIDSDPALLQCVDCTRRLGRVFASGECLKPEAAAKQAKKLKVIPPPAAVVPHPQGWVVNTAVGSAQQETIGGAVVFRTNGRGAASQRIKLEPRTAYRLRAKIRGVGVGEKSSAGIEVVYDVKGGGKATAGWSETTSGRYTGSAGWQRFEEEVAGDVKATGSAGELRIWWTIHSEDRGGSFVFEDVELTTLDGKSVIVNGGFDAVGARVGIPAALPPLDPAIAADLATIGAPITKAPPPPPPKNLLANGDFEQTSEEKQGQLSHTVATGWTVQYKLTAYSGSAITRDAARSGMYGLGFSKKTTATARATVEPGKTYRLSFWAKGEDRAGGKMVTVTLTGTTGTKASTTVFSGKVPDWTQLTLDVTTGAGDRWIDVAFAQGSDTVQSFHVDDVELIQVD